MNTEHHIKGPTHYPVTGLGFITKEWAKLFLENWNRAVELWNDGYLFSEEAETANHWYTGQIQQEYARLCCTWMLPNGFQEPHVVAEGG